MLSQRLKVRLAHHLHVSVVEEAVLLLLLNFDRLECALLFNIGRQVVDDIDEMVGVVETGEDVLSILLMKAKRKLRCCDVVHAVLNGIGYGSVAGVLGVLARTDDGKGARGVLDYLNT